MISVSVLLLFIYEFYLSTEIHMIVEPNENVQIHYSWGHDRDAAADEKKYYDCECGRNSSGGCVGLNIKKLLSREAETPTLC